MTERALTSVGASWTDLGDWIEKSYSEDEMRELVATVRKESVEEGIKIGKARTPKSNGHFVLPEASEMAEYCHQRPSQLKDDVQRDFINEMYVKTRRGINLKRGTLGYLASIYIKLNGKI